MNIGTRKRSKDTGLPPGTVIYSGERGDVPLQIDLILYDEKGSRSRRLKDVEDLKDHIEKKKIAWINICGLGDTGKLERIGEILGIHPLVMEDVANTYQRPKMDNLEDYIFIVLKMIHGMEGKKIDSEQVSIVLKDNMVITFQERGGDVFDPVRERIKRGKGRIRNMGADYLAYALLDSVVDKYFLVLETLGNRIDDIEMEVMKDPDKDTLRSIHTMKSELIGLRRSIWPLREVINLLQREDSNLISPDISIFLRDLYDHTIQVIDTLESFRDMISSLLDLYLSTVSNRMNEVMKVLTIIATIFIPLTFVAGIYGMNFNTGESPLNMPELDWYFGYPAVLMVMAAIAIAMLLFFRKKRWL